MAVFVCMALRQSVFFVLYDAQIVDSLQGVFIFYPNFVLLIPKSHDSKTKIPIGKKFNRSS